MALRPPERKGTELKVDEGICVNIQCLSFLRVLKEACGHLQASVGQGEGSPEDAS